MEKGRELKERGSHPRKEILKPNCHQMGKCGFGVELNAIENLLYGVWDVGLKEVEDPYPLPGR